MRAPDKNSRAQANYSRALLSLLRAVAFCTRLFVEFKSSGTVAFVLVPYPQNVLVREDVENRL